MRAFEILNKRILFFTFLAAFLLVSVLPVLISGFIILHRTEEELKSSLNESNYLIARAIAVEISDSNLRPWTDLLGSLASAPRAGSGLPESFDNLVDQAFRQETRLAVLSVQTAGRREPRHYVNRLFREELNRQDPDELTRLFSFRQTGESVGRPVLLDSGSSVYLPVEAADRAGGKPLLTVRGVFRMNPSLEAFDQDVSPMRRQIYVLDRNGDVLFRNGFAEIGPGKPLPYPLLPAGARAASVFRTVAFNFKGEKHLGYAYPMTVTGWRVVLVYPQDKAYALVSGTRRSILATLGAAVLLSLSLSFLLAWFHSSVIVHAKEALQRYADKLEQTNTELDAFASSISHDLSAPLRHIMGYADILEMRLKPTLDPKDLGHLEKIASASRHLHALIHDVLVFSKMGRSEIHKTRVSLSALVEATRGRLEPDIHGRAIAWRTDGDETLWGDSTMLQLVLFNLISNALKFTRDREHPLIAIGARPGPEETTVFVSDNGVGFDSREQDRLFGLFQRLHDRAEFEGHGVGLAHVRRIIAKHGGRTWAESRPGRGATFYFSLPVEARGTDGEMSR